MHPGPAVPWDSGSHWGVSIASPRLRRGVRASPACTKQMVKHGLTRSEINLHFASKSHNHVIILSIGVGRAPGSSPCSLLGWWQRGWILPRCCSRAPLVWWDCPVPCWFAGLRDRLRWEMVAEDRGMREQQVPITPPCPAASWFNLTPGFLTLCRGSPVGNASPGTFPHPPAQPRSKPSPVTPSFRQ